MLRISVPRDPHAPWRLLISGLVVIALLPAWQLAEVSPAVLLEARSLAAMLHFAAGFFPPSVDPAFLALLLRATLETLAVATTGVFFAVLLAAPLAIFATRSFGQYRGRLALGIWLRGPCRLLLLLARSIPEVVWALLFVRAVGLGPWAGVLALSVGYTGMLGKIYAEILESAQGEAGRILIHAGAGRLQALLYGFLPAAWDDLLSYTVYRWECGIRASVIMGFVGAGGLGQQLELSMRMMDNREVATILLLFFALVFLSDKLSARLRRGRACED